MSSDPKKVLGAVVFLIMGFFFVLFLIGRSFLPGDYQIEGEVVVSKSPDRAWQWLSRPKNWNKKMGRVQLLEETSDQEAKIGENLRIMAHLPGGGKLTSDIVVTDLIIGRLIGDKHLADRFNDRLLPIKNVKDQIELKPEGPKKTRIVFKETFDVEGVVNKWIAYLVIKPSADRLMAKILTDYEPTHSKN